MMSRNDILLYTLITIALVGLFLVVVAPVFAQPLAEQFNPMLRRPVLDQQQQQANASQVNDKFCAADGTKRPNSIEYLTHFSCGQAWQVGNQTVREFALIAREVHEIDIGEGHTFKAWTFNDTVPGPTMRMTEGDIVRITVYNAESSEHAHSLHMHSIHPGNMDGVEGKGASIKPGDSFTYQFTAQPYGVYPYHCHVSPVSDHINRGLYGMMIIDPKQGRPQVDKELVMMMNGYDEDYELEGHVTIRPANATLQTESGEVEEEAERENEIYTVNGKAFDYMKNPIQIKANEKVRVYLANMVEFDPVNSMHLHGNMFDYSASGTELSDQNKITTDIVTLGQGDRGIMEFHIPYAGKYMIHAHVSEFTDLGWMGFIEVT